MEVTIKSEHENNVVFNLDNNTQLEFLNSQKTIVVIDKERFLILKQFQIDNSPDEDYAEFLKISLDKVRYFKHKMQIFEDSIRVRRRAARLAAQRKKSAKPVIRKREMTSEERYKKARELISKNFSTNQISKILKISERSVTRFKKRIREEKRRLKAEGKIQVAADDPDDENSFKYLTVNEKVLRAKELFRKRLKIQEISDILKISERSVRRWKDRLLKMESNPEAYQNSEIKTAARNNNSFADEDDEDNLLEFNKPLRRKRRTYLDKEKVQYAKELIENGLSNKEMSMLLELSISCVRKLKMKIIDGTADELIDDSEEHYKNINDTKKRKKNGDFGYDEGDGNDPLNVLEEVSYAISLLNPQNCGFERKPKVSLSDKDMLVARLLRENAVRTMDIAKMMDISERSVTRLLSKSREKETIEYHSDIIEHVERLLNTKDEILNEDIEEQQSNMVNDDTKESIGMSLISMNTKVINFLKLSNLKLTH